MARPAHPVSAPARRGRPRAQAGGEVTPCRPCRPPASRGALAPRLALRRAVAGVLRMVRADALRRDRVAAGTAGRPRRGPRSLAGEHLGAELLDGLTVLLRCGTQVVRSDGVAGSLG